jgi:predicted transcriptional regulator
MEKTYEEDAAKILLPAILDCIKDELAKLSDTELRVFAFIAVNRLSEANRTPESLTEALAGLQEAFNEVVTAFKEVQKSVAEETQHASIFMSRTVGNA